MDFFTFSSSKSSASSDVLPDHLQPEQQVLPSNSVEVTPPRDGFLDYGVLITTCVDGDTTTLRTPPFLPKYGPGGSWAVVSKDDVTRKEYSKKWRPMTPQKAFIRVRSQYVIARCTLWETARLSNPSLSNALKHRLKSPSSPTPVRLTADQRELDEALFHGDQALQKAYPRVDEKEYFRSREQSTSVEEEMDKDLDRIKRELLRCEMQFRDRIIYKLRECMVNKKPINYKKVLAEFSQGHNEVMKICGELQAAYKAGLERTKKTIMTCQKLTL
ncbi:hypothetical protein VTJ49DRAFT_7588 [Mycothermus thermophilus]|uniref:Uncharacterized protein n=1 Tax=Humicola insolens TaxID=85995 RepID=A0ABR3VH15_HUMIN